MTNNTLKEKMKILFIHDTDNTMIQFFRYLFVGGAAFLADFFTLYFLKTVMYYLLAASFAFVIGLVTNYCLSKLFVFTEKKKSAFAEFMVFGLIGLIGLGLTVGILWVCNDMMGISVMVSKIIATIIVFLWNFLARKYLLYSTKSPE